MSIPDEAHGSRGKAAVSLLLTGGAVLGLYALGFGSGADGHGPIPIPLADTGYALGDDPDAYEGFLMSGGPPPDGIPAIDEPKFVDTADADLDPDDMVIGFTHGGEARAYPHEILVLHEIVNDRVGGLNVAVTYCPLTATAQGFERGNTTLGVSGQLLNSNLVMFDRETESYFSQIGAVGLRGPHRGETLVEVDVIWTTWDRWRSAHPDTRVLSRDTGYMRNYDRDPYGSYNPLGGYYEQDGTIFPLMHPSDRHHAKEMVVGARTAEGSAYFVLEELEREGVQSTDDFLAVYDPDLHTGHVYLRSGEAPDEIADLTPRGDGSYALEGESYGAADLPFERVVAVDAFFFAWHAFFPDSESP